MLTPEQIQNLKPGDTVLVEAEVSSPQKDGAIVSHGCITHALPASKLYPLPTDSQSSTVNSQSKYDPTRLFKKGDKVRVVKCKRRNYSGRETGDIGIVDRNESPGTAEVEVVFGDEDLWEIDPAYLELITPVEELEPYSIDPANSNVLFKHGKKFATFESDDEAQELCDRLNAEWRKEQNHG